jgi:hypothetical protein
MVYLENKFRMISPMTNVQLIRVAFYWQSSQDKYAE